jgi:glycosyltransferase involved in cell wall biosynthesis
MELTNKVSVIVPSNHEVLDLQRIVEAICIQSIKPAEIVIIDSSRGPSNECPVVIVDLCKSGGVDLLYFRRTLAFPGDARNIGIDIATSDFIAFIDVKTIPKPHWLETSLKILANHEVAGIWGATCFSARTSFERLVRDGFFGLLPRKTLPGSVFRRKTFYKTGQFIEWVRAGEDTEWMRRLEVLKIPIGHSPSALVDYVGLIDLNTKQLLKKWYRNYTASRELPHIFSQKMLWWLTLYPVLILIAFNWNDLIAGWRMDSPLYIGHVTKIVFITPTLIYVLVRGLILPFHRGVDLNELLPLRFLAITLICLMGDLVKVAVFSIPKRLQDLFMPSHT